MVSLQRYRQFDAFIPTCDAVITKDIIILYYMRKGKAFASNPVKIKSTEKIFNIEAIHC